MRNDHLDTALPAGSDRQQYARTLARTHEAILSGRRPPARPRPVITDSWDRMQRLGLHPDRGADCAPVSTRELEYRRAHCGLTDNALFVLRSGLVTVAEDAGHIMVIVDVDGRILWREGSPAVFRRADKLGFVEGACWTEDTVGTNAIGTALVERRPVQVHSAEHYVRSHHPWTCAAAPIHDPRDGRLLGAVDVSGSAATVHPSTLALVHTTADLAEAQLHEAHRHQLDRLRAIAAPILARLGGQALVADRSGWVAASIGLPPIDHVPLPDPIDVQHAWLPTFGHCRLEQLPEGVLVRPLEHDTPSPTTRIVLNLRQPNRPNLTLHRESGSWTHQLSPRHAEILFALAVNRAGRTAAELAEELFGARARTITVRAEMSRLRKQFGDLLDHRPYRFLPEIDVAVEQDD